MEWKLPDFVQQAWDKVRNTGNDTEDASSCTTETNGAATSLIPKEEDDLGVRLVQHKGTVPFRRVESAIHTFVQVAVPADLDRLYRHQNNIKKWRTKKEREKLRAEYINAARTVKQLTRNLQEMESLRAKVIEEDLPVFDRRLKPAKDQALDSITEFMAIHGEALNGSSVGHVDPVGHVDTPKETDPETAENIANLKSESQRDNNGEENSPPPLQVFSQCSPSVCGDCDTSPEAQAPAKAFVQLRGNQLVIEPTDPATESENNCQDAACSNECRNSDLSSISTEPKGDLQTSEQIQIQESESEETNEWWEKLRKDLEDLHCTIRDFSTLVHEQGETVDNIEANIEKAEENIKEGNIQLKKATVIKATMFPVLGAVVGGVVGGPIGFAAGLKLGSVAGGLAAAGVTGTVIGYQGGKFLKEKQDPNTMEMKPIAKEENEKKTNTEEET